MIDSSFFDTETLKQIADNTKPLDLFNQNLGWWSFGTAIVGVFISSLAAVFSFLGYKYQKLSAQKLEEIAPGDISYDSVSFSLVHNIIDLKSIFKDVTSYDDYPVKLIIDSDKLPDDLIDLSKYEKNKKNYDSACNLILAWRTYNIYLSHLSEIITTNKNVEKSTYSTGDA